MNDLPNEELFRATNDCPDCDGSGEGEVTRWWPATQDEPPAPRAWLSCARCGGAGFIVIGPDGEESA